MGAHSTLTVSRRAAIKKIVELAISASNEVLEDLLFALVGQRRLYNFTVQDCNGEDDSVLERLD